TSSPRATASALHASLTAAQSQFPSTISHAVNPSAHSGGLQAVQSIADQIRNGRFEIGIAAGLDPVVPRGVSRSRDESGAVELGVADDDVEAYRVLSLGRVKAVGGDCGCWGGEAEMVSSVVDVVGGEVTSRHGGEDTDGETGGECQDDGIANLHDDNSSTPTPLFSASLLLMTRATALRLHQPIHAHYVAATSSPPTAFPTNPHTAPCNAIQHLFQRTGLSKDDIDVFEIEELSAAAVIYCVRTLGLDQRRVNASGGAMGLGGVGCVEGLREVVMGLEESGRNGGRVVVVAVGGRDVGRGTVGLWVNEVGV
ncbi:hypothetical protein IMSHALPRED_003677, partial [Imshaugia aleurites]